MTKKQHGGANRNQGRKKSPNPKVNITFRLSKSIVDFLKAIPKGSQTEFVEKALSSSIRTYDRMAARITNITIIQDESK